MPTTFQILAVSVLPTWHIGISFTPYTGATSYSLNVDGAHYETLTTEALSAQMLVSKRIGPFAPGSNPAFAVTAHVGQVTHTTAAVSQRITCVSSWPAFYRQVLHHILAEASLTIGGRTVGFCENEYGAARVLPDSKPANVAYPSVAVLFPALIGSTGAGLALERDTWRFPVVLRDANNDGDEAAGALAALAELIKHTLEASDNAISDGHVSGITAGCLEFDLSAPARPTGKDVVEKIVNITLSACSPTGFQA